ncbi:hypothetical protein BJ508DRAFT_120217 [Ascobolus immersus RN42]|uniref:Uncharacterized protein n=1 Tax=Ascobolus immersus RN42 TaxID=1160509 RepID=A0A3N4IKX0_ASCIM|nr:hypothetical protein BJ508DRAFT_120217 [Ascobolus immersus RN42]
MFIPLYFISFFLFALYYNLAPHCCSSALLLFYGGLFCSSRCLYVVMYRSSLLADYLAFSFSFLLMFMVYIACDFWGCIVDRFPVIYF